ncbi:MAG: class I SAM-dependent methyltransferase [Bacteroidetes bacterium]|nr:class I SAM-dependent methyltransferase [Bacteroidota bacterium]
METKNLNIVKLDSWVKEIIVDPLSKGNLVEENNHLVSNYGRYYPITNGICDFRLFNNNTTEEQKLWKKGQLHYEHLAEISIKNDSKSDYVQGFNGVKEIYDDIIIKGDCLDVGGGIGTLRAFLQANQKYISCDPFINAFNDLLKRKNLIKAYPFIIEPVNFICCVAEFLPFKSCSFDTVHMRSVIDHFLNPEFALNEAYRVLRKDGILIVGLYVTGGKSGKIGLKKQIKNLIISVLPFLKRDHHIWHPTYNKLVKLISNRGFKIIKTHWQKGYNDTVCYLECKKISEF